MLATMKYYCASCSKALMLVANQSKKRDATAFQAAWSQLQAPSYATEVQEKCIRKLPAMVGSLILHSILESAKFGKFEEVWHSLALGADQYRLCDVVTEEEHLTHNLHCAQLTMGSLAPSAGRMVRPSGNYRRSTTLCAHNRYSGAARVERSSARCHALAREGLSPPGRL